MELEKKESLNVEVGGAKGSGLPRQGCYTKTKLKKYSYSWIIDKFSFYRSDTGTEDLASLEFPAGASKDGRRWFVILQPHDGNGDTEDFVGLTLFLLSGKRKAPVRANCKFSILNVNLEEVKVWTESHTFHPGGDGWGTSYFVGWNCLTKEAEQLLPGDKLTIIIEVSVKMECETTATIGPGQEKLSVPECSLPQDLGRLFESESFSDVTLISGEGEEQQEFKTHKSVLAARSSVFFSAFDNDEMEKEKIDTLKIPEVKADVLRELLRFIYTGKVNCLNEGVKFVTELLSAAVKYKLKGLMATCEESLCTSLSTGNAAEILMIADSHCCEDLKENTIKFINSDGNEVMKTEGWTTMIELHPHLLSELYSKSLESLKIT